MNNISNGDNNSYMYTTTTTTANTTNYDRDGTSRPFKRKRRGKCVMCEKCSS